MGDTDFWKRRYARAWEKSSAREELVMQRIETDSGWKVVPVGLGAASTEFLSGSASEHGQEKGAADLRIEDMNIHLEVTGPLGETVGSDDPIWVRPDKIYHARRHFGVVRSWIVHCLEQPGLLRVIALNDRFFDRFDAGDFLMVYPTIRGTMETFVEIPADHACVRSWDYLIEWLKTLDSSGEDGRKENEPRSFGGRVLEWMRRNL